MSNNDEDENVFDDDDEEELEHRKRGRLDSDDDDNDDDEDDDDNEQDDEGEEEEEEENEVESSSNKKSNKVPKRETKRGRRDYRRFILDEAAVADDDEDEEDDDYELDERGKPVDREILDAELVEANMLVERRHEANRAFQQASAAELAREYQEKYRTQGGGYRSSAFRGGRGDIPESELLTNDVAKQSLIPGVNDPGIWRIRVANGLEKQLVRSILWKTMSRQREGKPVLIKSVFCTLTVGYIYIEAIEEPLAREAIAGLSGIYYTTLKRVPLAEMTTLLTFSVKSKPVKEGQWCRVKRGILKGDLVKIVRLIEGEDGGTRALIQAIPRPDYDNVGKGKGKSNLSSRPLQRMFVPEDAKAKGHVVERRRGFGSEWFDYWNGDSYKHGFLFKDVKVDTFLNTADAAPKIHELTLFREKSKQENGGDSDSDEDPSTTNNGKQTSFMNELARQLDVDDVTKVPEGKVVPFRVGDVVQVTDGEFRNLRGTILSINEVAQQAVVRPIHSEDLGNITVETTLLVKYIRPGAHIKVVNGTHLGQTGRVVSVHKVDGDLIAAILADGTNTEFTANVSHLQISNEITSGLNNLGGYELYDLVMLSANEYAVVVFVGTEFLKVLTQHDIEKNVRPVEIKGKKSAVRGASGAFDHMKNPLCVGDTVSVVEGVHSKKIGTVKHINRSVLWLHSTNYLKNSGVFVVKGKSCLLAGGQVKDSSSATAAAVINATYGINNNNNNNLNNNLLNQQSNRGGSSSAPFAKRGSKDPMIGKSVTITKGSYKGLLAHIIDATETQYSVELHGRLKKINIDKSNVLVTGDRDGATDKEGRHINNSIEGWMGIPSTPALTAQTPLHLAETPLYMMGNETPLHGSVSTPSRPDTPGRDNDTYGYDVWKPNALDSIAPPSAQSNSSAWGGSDWRSPQPEPTGWGNVPISGGSSNHNSYETKSNSEPSGWGHLPVNNGIASWDNTNSSMSSSISVASSEPSGWGHLPVNNGIASWDSQRSSHYEDSRKQDRRSSNSSKSDITERGWNGHISEWEPGMIVCFTATKYIGREGVLEGKLQSDGTFDIALKDDKRIRIPNTPSSQIILADPKKRNTVKIMTGSKRGLVGEVKKIEGNDVFVNLSNDIQVFRLSQIVKVDDDDTSYYSNNSGGSSGGYGYGRR